ncbi:hypothetical protein BGX21_004053 [Mortierella sp. AD011]|nr:hypothetical protein BGX20_001697 [Mortierella sp. AD010]KAF9374724.1 hypothetical protein BGX21_004053 [Mortierella sp. AD011]
MTKENVFVLGTVRLAKAQEAALAEKYNIHYSAPTREEVLKQLKDAKSDGIVFKAFYRGFASHYTYGRADKLLLDQFPEGLKLIASVGAGYDFVDVNVATRNKQLVTNTPGVVDDASADATVLLMLSTLRHQYEIEYAMRNQLGISPRMGRDPEGLTIGIVGMGGIGRAVAKRVLAMGMKVIYHNRQPVSEALISQEPHLKETTYISSLDELLETSDVVSIHVPLSPETHHLFGEKQFAKMKRGSYVINTSRGPVVDEEALVNALESGHIAGAGLDVFENEPKVHPALLKSMNVALMPHLATFTKETITNMETLAMKNIDHYLYSGTPLTPVNDIN